MLIFPLLVPINMDVLVIEYGIFFYAYGIYLHWGYELDYPDAHHPVLNTAYQHYLHHAKSVNKKPYHTGFFFKIWDQMFGTTWAGECGCVKCERKRGKRTRAQWEKISATKPDYACLLTTKFWLQGMGRRNTAKAA
jgi:lathosterol oxidase